MKIKYYGLLTALFACFVFLFALFQDLMPHFKTWCLLREKKKAFLAKLDALQKAYNEQIKTLLPADNANVSGPDLFAFVNLVQQNALKVQSMRFSTLRWTGNQNFLPVHLEASGFFQDIFSFMQKLPAINAQLMRFSLQAAVAQKVSFQGELFLYAMPSSVAIFKEHKPENSLFCTGGNGILSKAPGLRELKQYALTELRMTGYFYQQGKVWGLVALPDDSVKEVEVGQRMGKESGLVTQVEPKEITVSLPHHAFYKLYLK